MGSTAALALIPLLISGYLFNATFYPMRYFSSKAEGQKLFFMAAGSGVLICSAVFIASGALLASGTTPAWALAIAKDIDSSVPIPHACKLVACLLVGATLGWPMNFLYWPFYGAGKKSARAVYNKLIDTYGNSLAQLLRKAADSQKLVVITLRSRKIYCGRILEVPSSIERADACIEILPTFSTYRNKDTLRMGPERTEYPVIALWEARNYLESRKAVLKTFENSVKKHRSDYDEKELHEAFELLHLDIREAAAVIDSVGEPLNFEPADWVKVIPVGEIESASFYDADANDKWFAQPDEASRIILLS